jgi:large subunit ribosomal protein L11
VYADKSFDFVIKQPPVAVQLIEAAKVKKGSPEPHVNKVGSVSWEQVKEIAQIKMEDLNCFSLDEAMSMVAGTARSMGITIDGDRPSKN